MLRRYLVAFFIATFLLGIFSLGSTSCTKIRIGPTIEDSVPTPPHLRGLPNIILILGDDIGYEIPTVDGGGSYSTPTIDMMAQNGVRFTQCHSSPLCSPSRFMLTTGQYNFRNYTTWGSMNLNQRTIGNLMHDLGYATCVAGKWQFDNGDLGVKTFGYDKYCIWDYVKEGTEEGHELTSAYKNPGLLQDSVLLNGAATLGKYGPDIMNQYVSDFIDSNKTKPFFIYYPTPLCHYPYSPTPDDPEFASWDPNVNRADTAFFPSMVKYMDKQINIILQKLKTDGIDKNTIVLFCGDNGTPQQIYSLFNGQLIQGGKSHTYEYGTHVPLIAYSPGSIDPGVNESIIDFTDFYPTLAALAHYHIPVTTDTLDGQSFRRQIFRSYAHGRDWIYTWYNAHPDLNPGKNLIYVQDTTYKFYEQDGFFNIKTDILEKNKIKVENLTRAEQETRRNFHQILDSIHR